MDIGIIGGGISSLMCAYSLSKNMNNKITIFEKGKSLDNRKCPLLAKEIDKCAKCKTCAIMEGLAGAGAFSDGKYNITDEFGGWLKDFIGSQAVIDYENKAIEILESFGAQTGRYRPDNELKKLCMQNNLNMLQSECIHLGTDANYITMKNMVNSMPSNVSIKTGCNVVDVYNFNNKKRIEFINNSLNKEDFDIIIFAVGRSGSSFLSDWCNRNSIKLINNQVDIGVRVELPALIWEDFEQKIYEPKILYRTKQYGDLVRMFCFNGRGEVVTENTNGVLSVNGHAYKAEEKKTNNTNFALLSTIKFTQPFNQPIDYARSIANITNMIGGGSVLVQRLGDLEAGRRSDESRINKGTVKPTLSSAVPGDLSLCIPKRQLDNIIETLHALDKVAPGTANPDTLLYGLECKYYSARPVVNEHFEIQDNVFAIGDGAGFTRSLAQAAAQGLYIADYINNK